MTKTTSNLLSRIFKNEWVITVTATLIGVFAALYLNELVANRKLNHQKSIAGENILAEISSNDEKLKNAVEKHIDLIDIIHFMNEYADLENETLIVHKDTMKTFQMNFPNTMIVSDSILIKGDIYDYNGTLTLQFSVPQLEVTTIAWNTLKDSGISAMYGFECLMFLEGIYKITDEISKRNSELMEFFMGSKEPGEKYSVLLTHLNLVIDFEESLIKMIEEQYDELKECG